MSKWHYGLQVNPSPTERGKYTVYAEVVPATPLVVKRDGRSLRHWLMAGRSWKEPHIRWWFEVMSDLDGGTHHIDHDGGAMTLRQAIWKAQDAVEVVVAELDSPDANLNGGKDE